MVSRSLLSSSFFSLSSDCLARGQAMIIIIALPRAKLSEDNEEDDDKDDGVEQNYSEDSIFEANTDDDIDRGKVSKILNVIHCFV